MFNNNQVNLLLSVVHGTWTGMEIPKKKINLFDIFQESMHINMQSMNMHPSFAGNKAKGRISKRVFQENQARQIFRKTNISYPLIRTRTCAYQGVRNVCFSKNLACLVFLKHPFWDLPFYVITDGLLPLRIAKIVKTQVFFRDVRRILPG